MTDEHDRWALVFAHPGHELRCHHFIERARPVVCILTDGAGSTGMPRIHESSELLASLGATPGPVFGALSDREAYAALMDGDPTIFLAHVRTLSDVFVASGITAVLVDAAEGYNPVHDVCHWLGRAATKLAAAAGRPIAEYELDLVSHPDGHGDGVRVALDEPAFARKLAAAERYRPLAAEAAGALTQHGVDAFRTEFLRRLPPAQITAPSEVPYYERVGEDRVRAGRYTTVLRYDTHVRPILEALTLMTSRA